MESTQGPKTNGRIDDLLHIYSHFQTDIENVKQRQWRDFNATLAGQGSLLLLSRDFPNENVLFAILSFLLWLAGTYFLVENREVLEVYRSGKDECYKELKKDEVISKILDPPGTPVIRGKYHHRILSLAVLMTTALVICLILRKTSIALLAPLEVWTCVVSVEMLILLKILECVVPKLSKTGTAKSWFYRNFIE